MSEITGYFSYSIGILDVPDHIIETICSNYFTRKMSRTHRHTLCDILTEIPTEILTLRLTCRRLRDIIDSCPFQFSLELFDKVLLEEKYLSYFDHLQKNFNWKISVIALSLYWSFKIQASFAVNRLVSDMSKLEFHRKFFSDYSDILSPKRIIVEWNECYDDSISSPYFPKIVEMLNEFGFLQKMHVLVSSIGDYLSWNQITCNSNVDILEVCLDDDRYSENSEAMQKAVDLFAPFSQVQNLSYGYLIKDLAPFKQLERLKFLEIEGCIILTKTMPVKLPSVTNLLIRIEDFQSPVQLSDLLSQTFPNLEVLKLEDFTVDTIHYEQEKPLILNSCHTVLISRHLLNLVSNSTVIKNLGVDCVVGERELNDVLAVTADLRSLVFGFIGEWRKTLPMILKRFTNLSFLELRIFGNNEQCLKDDFLSIIAGNHDLFEEHAIELLVLINFKDDLDQVVYMKPSLSRSGVDHFVNISRVLSFVDYHSDFSLTQSFEKFDRYFIAC